MVNKRKLESDDSIKKSSPVEVIAESLENHPLCMHGPTLLFSNSKGRYFSCSSCRNKKDCTVHISEEDWESENVKKRNEKYLNLMPKVDKMSAFSILTKVKSQKPMERAYCVTCEEFYAPLQVKKHNKNHVTISSLTDDQLSQPSSWLPTLENDTVEAQYMFSKKCVTVILQTLKQNNIRNILCIGTPTIHDALQRSQGFKSILMDMDKRYSQFNDPNKFIYYNMFNNYCFNGRQDEELLEKFIKESSDSGLCIVMDPPFGGRVEPLAYTIKQLTGKYKTLCNKESLPVIWAFPYFSEPYITNIMPELVMHDYQVEYENHGKFHSKNQKGRKFGSPVRLFTNLPLNTIRIGSDPKYKHCEKCKIFVAKTNQHCNKCGKCTSKNGMTYKHCKACKKCVKPTFFHCATCERCCQEKDHVCGVVVMSQSCFECNEKGHKKTECPTLQRVTSNKKKRKNA